MRLPRDEEPGQPDVAAARKFFPPPVDSTGRFRRRHDAPARDCGSEGVCSVARPLRSPFGKGRNDMNSIIYLIGLVVVVVAILGFFGLR
jgi:hypothetical protein